MLDCLRVLTSIPIFSGFDTWADGGCSSVQETNGHRPDHLNALSRLQAEWLTSERTRIANGRRFCYNSLDLSRSRTATRPRPRRTGTTKEDRDVGLFGRIWRVIKGWLLIGVEKAEDPEVILTEAKEAMERELA